MPAIEAIYHTGTPVTFNSPYNITPYNELNFTVFRPKSAYVAISSVTANQVYACVLSAAASHSYNFNPGGDLEIITITRSGFPDSSVTISVVTASSTFALLPCDISLNGNHFTYGVPATLSVIGGAYSENVATTVTNDGSVTVGTWTITQDSAKNVLVSCTSFGPGQHNRVFYPYNDNAAADLQPVPQVWKVALQNQSGVEITSALVRPSVVTTYPSVTLDASHITATTTYNIAISRKVVNSVANGVNWYAYRSHTTVLTAPAVTTGGNANNMFSWLNNDYWYLTDLQVNLGTRAVTHRHGTPELRPNDTVNFGVFFHNGTSGVDPVATDLRLAVRSSTNASAYYFWANPSVTTTSVSGDIYYTITVTASDEDLLAAQATRLLAGFNSNQILLAEVQWTTTRGTFTSDTFNIWVANEVVREPDV